MHVKFFNRGLKLAAILSLITLKIFVMKDTEKKDKQKSENPMKDYNPTSRDFQRTEEDIDLVSQSKKKDIEAKDRQDANKRTEKGNTTPNKNRMS